MPPFRRIPLPCFLAAGLLLVACDGRIDPEDDAGPYPIPPGVSVKPLRTAPYTGGLNIEGETPETSLDTMPGMADTAQAESAGQAQTGQSSTPR